jgi:hypothetical protein
MLETYERLSAWFLGLFRRRQVAIQQPSTPPASPPLGTPGSNPAWFHEKLTLKIGRHEYAFRTFSFYDVWTLYPHLASFKALMAAGRMLSAVEEAKIILQRVAPVLAARDADCAAFAKDQAAINLLFDFYRRQDWTRMDVLGKETTGPKADDALLDPHYVFLAAVSLAAKYCGMDSATFVEQRFEFCADQIVACKKVMDQAEPPVAKSWGDVYDKMSLQLGAPQKLDPANLPEFLKNVKIGGEPS